MTYKNINTTRWCTVKINNTYLKVNINGEIQRLMKSGNWKYIPNVCNHMNGMNVIVIEDRQFTRSKLLGCIYLNLNINKNYICKFKDKNRMNCKIKNLSFIPQ